MWYMHDFGWGWMAMGLFLMVIFWGSIIALIVWIVRRATNRGASSSGISPLDIARERYAKGEITREQFEQMKRDL